NGPPDSASRTAGKPVGRRGEYRQADTRAPSWSIMPLIIGGSVLGALLLIGAVVAAIVLFWGDNPTQQNSKQPIMNKDVTNDGPEDNKAPQPSPNREAFEPAPNPALGALSEEVVKRVKR